MMKGILEKITFNEKARKYASLNIFSPSDPFVRSDIAYCDLRITLSNGLKRQINFICNFS